MDRVVPDEDERVYGWMDRKMDCAPLLEDHKHV